MNLFLGNTPFHITELMAAENEFHRIYGKAMSQWAMVEERLFKWFWYCSGSKLGVARATFYSARNFSARADMLSSVIEPCGVDADIAEFLKAAVKASRNLARFRNAIAHGEPWYDNRLNTKTTGQMLLLEAGESPEYAAESAVDCEKISNAIHHWQELSRVLGDGLYEGQNNPALFPELTERVRSLPNQADLPPNHHTPSKPKQPKRPSQKKS